MTKIIFLPFLLVFYFSNISNAQIAYVKPADIAKYKTQNILVVLYKGEEFNDYNEYIKKLIADNWTFSGYEFVDQNDLKFHKGRTWLGFMFTTDEKVLKMYSALYWGVSNSHKPSIASQMKSYIPDVDLKTFNEGRIISGLQVIQNTLNIIDENQLKKFNNKVADELYNLERNKLKEVTLYIPESVIFTKTKGKEKGQIEPVIKEIKEMYPYKMEVVNEDELNDILRARQPNCTYLRTSINEFNELAGWVITTDTGEIICFEREKLGSITSFKKWFIRFFEKLN